MKYRCGFKVVARCYLEVEADCIEDAMNITDEEMVNAEIGSIIEDIEWEGTSAEQIRPLMEVVGIDEDGTIWYNDI